MENSNLINNEINKLELSSEKITHTQTRTPMEYEFSIEFQLFIVLARDTFPLSFSHSFIQITNKHI